MKEPQIDFLIEKGEKDWSPDIIFRFYPKRSHCHGFGDECPDAWGKVYKVYYSWAIIEDDEKVFDMGWDECSELVNMDKHIEYVISKKKKFHRALTFGQPGSDWEFRYRKARQYKDCYDEKEGWVWKPVRTPENDTLELTVFNNISNQGYRFTLDMQQVSGFVEYIKKINQHMLDNSEPI